MTTVNMLDAKTNLSRLVSAVESGAESEIIIARNGRPAVRIVPLLEGNGLRLGLAKGKFGSLQVDEALDAEIAAEFYEAVDRDCVPVVEQEDVR